MRLRAVLIPVAIVLVAIAAMIGYSHRTFERFFTRGERYLEARQYAEATIEFQNATRMNPQSVDAQMKLAEAYMSMGRTASAAAAYDRACAIDEHNRAACLQAASTL